MASTNFSYQKLRKNRTELEGGGELEEFGIGGGDVYGLSRSKGWLRLRGSYSSSRRRWWRRRPKVRIPGLRRVLGRKARLVTTAVSKVVKRFREGRSHLGELFSGNYMFMQINPSSHMSYLEKSYMAGHGHAPLPPSSRYYLPWVA